MAGIYADEAITGTKMVKRDGFLKMINDCMAAMVDVILTKSISRFSRNLVDTLQYVCMLKDKGIAVIFEMESKRKKLTDMLLDGKITKEAYNAKYNELTRKINPAKGERALYSVNVEAQQHIGQRMREIRTCIAEADMLDKFDRVVFGRIVEKVIVEDISEDATIDPYKLTFVLRGMEDRVVSDAKNKYKNLDKKVV